MSGPNDKKSKGPLMRDTKNTTYLALGCVGFIASAAVPAAAQETDRAERRDDNIVVIGERFENDYSAEEIVSPKATAKLLNTPRIVNVITEDVLEDSASFSFSDALRTVPGITLGAGEGGVASADIPLIRGVDATGDVFVDGARDVGSQTRETFAVERIEVFKGPNSAFGGRGSAGGVINIVSKLARAGNSASATAIVGTDNFYRATADVNAQISDDLAVRINGMYHDTDVPRRDAVRQTRWGIAPSLTYGIGSDTHATLSYYHYETDGIPDYGIPLTSRGQLPGGRREAADVDYDNFYGLIARDFQKSRIDSVTFLFEHDFGNGWILSDTARYSNARNEYIVTNPDDSAGNVANGLVWRNVKSRNSTNQSLVNNLNLAGTFNTGGLQHQIATGFEFSTSDTVNRSYSVATGDSGCSASAIANFDCTSLNNPDPFDPWNGSITLSDTPNKASGEDVSLYLFDTVTIVPQLLLNGGVRWTNFKASGSGAGRGGSYSVTNESSFFSFQGGVIYKPSEATSLYASYATSKSPPGSDIGEGSNNAGSNNANYEPQTTENWEIGAKAQLFGGALLLSGAVFQIDRGNIIDNDPIAGPIPIASNARLRGFEVGATGTYGPVSVFAGYTYVHSDIRDDSANDGNLLPNTPESNLAVTTAFAVTPRLSIGGGVYHASERFADTANLIQADGYWRVDANASYQLSKSVEVRLNVQNVGDERYITKLRNPHFAVPSNARQALLSISARY